ncbi:MAG: hypothetical protein JWM27_545 [Gemmatimonadetes bacterium]|nr:hypothetical protein [Gemmatimonadota bacterium]
MKPSSMLAAAALCAGLALPAAAQSGATVTHTRTGTPVVRDTLHHATVHHATTRHHATRRRPVHYTATRAATLSTTGADGHTTRTTAVVDGSGMHVAQHTTHPRHHAKRRHAAAHTAVHTGSRGGSARSTTVRRDTVHHE